MPPTTISLQKASATPATSSAAPFGKATFSPPSYLLEREHGGTTEVDNLSPSMSTSCRARLSGAGFNPSPMAAKVGTRRRALRNAPTADQDAIRRCLLDKRGGDQATLVGADHGLNAVTQV